MPKDFLPLAAEIGNLLNEKNIAYGDSFARAGKVLEIIFPNGVEVSQYGDMLAVARVLDKLFRIGSKKDAFGESPWKDVAGYGILGAWNDANDSKGKRDG